MKLLDEANKVRVHMSAVIREDMKKPKRFLHNYVDLYVESARASPYFMGHVYAILIPALIVMIFL